MRSSLHKLLNIPDGMEVKQFFITLAEDKHKEVLKNLLTNHFLDPADEEEIKNVYTSKDLLHPWLHGGLGFFLFAKSADRYAIQKEITSDTISPTKNAKPTAPQNYLLQTKEYLDDPKVSSFLFDFYEVTDKAYKGKLSLHRVGTTSYILKLKNKLALKIIKPQFFGSGKIIEATEEYFDKYDCLGDQYSPEILISGKYFIIMKFISGKTLREYMEAEFPALDYENLDEVKRLELLGKRLNTVKSVAVRLCEILCYCKELGIIHSDLSPDNIIVMDNAPEKLCLIDFGPNHLHVVHIGSTYSFVRSQNYTAPEVQKNTNSATEMSDVYSLGILLIEMLSDERLDVQEVAFWLDHVWQYYPDFAKIIEEMVDENPQNRFFELKRDDLLYPKIKERIESAFKMYVEVYLQRETFLQKLRETLTMGQAARVKELSRKYKAVQAQETINHEVKRLLSYAMIAQWLEGATVILFAAFLAVDLGLSPPVLMEALSKIGLTQFLSLVPGNWYENLPGRIVGLSFTIVATQYYLNLFSAVTVQKADKTTEFWMRFNAICFSGPALWALVYRPKDWAFCTVVGVWMTAANNYYTYRTARYASKKIKEEFDLPPSSTIPLFLKEFETWWVDMANYGAGILLLAFLIYYNKAKDEWMYVMGIAGLVNILILMRTSCIVKAPMMRAGLERLYSGLERVKRKQVLSESTLVQSKEADEVAALGRA